MTFRIIKVFICAACLASSVAAPAQQPTYTLDIIDMAAISRMSPQQLEVLAEGLAAEEIMRTKRSSAQALSSVVSKASSGLQSKVGLLGQASAFISSASSKSGGHDEHTGYSYEPHDEKVDYWGLKKSILYTLFQAVKAITGGVTILKGQLIKGGGALATTLGKVIAVKGDAVSNLGKKIVSSAALSAKKPHSTPVYGPPPVSHVTHVESYPPSAYGAPTAPAHYAHSAPSAPSGYAAHKYPSHLDVSEMVAIRSVVQDIVDSEPKPMPPMPPIELQEKYIDLVDSLCDVDDLVGDGETSSTPSQGVGLKKPRIRKSGSKRGKPLPSFGIARGKEDKNIRETYKILNVTETDFFIDCDDLFETGRAKLNGVHAGVVILTPLGETPDPAGYTGHTPLEPPPSVLNTVYSAIKNAFSPPPTEYSQPSTGFSPPTTGLAVEETHYQPPPPPQSIPSFKPMSWGAVDSYGQPAAPDAFPQYDPRNPHPPFTRASSKHSEGPNRVVVKSHHGQRLSPDKIQKINQNLEKLNEYIANNIQVRSSEELPKFMGLEAYSEMLKKGQVPLFPTPVVTDNEIGVLSADILPDSTTTSTTPGTTTTTTTTTTTQSPTTESDKENKRERKDVKYFLRGNRIIVHG